MPLRNVDIYVIEGFLNNEVVLTELVPFLLATSKSREREY